MNTMQTNPQDILKTLSLSFEVFPPKKWEDFPGLYETLDELKGLHPEFISCTYGAAKKLLKSPPTLKMNWVSVPSHILPVRP